MRDDDFRHKYWRCGPFVGWSYQTSGSYFIIHHFDRIMMSFDIEYGSCRGFRIGFERDWSGRGLQLFVRMFGWDFRFIMSWRRYFDWLSAIEPAPEEDE